jgi:hypothetical protein
MNFLDGRDYDITIYNHGPDGKYTSSWIDIIDLDKESQNEIMSKFKSKSYYDSRFGNISTSILPPLLSAVPGGPDGPIELTIHAEKLPSTDKTLSDYIREVIKRL